MYNVAILYLYMTDWSVQPDMVIGPRLLLTSYGGFYKLALSDFEAIFGSERQRVRKYSGLYDRTRWRSESKRGQKMAKRNPSSFIPFLGGNL